MRVTSNLLTPAGQRLHDARCGRLGALVDVNAYGAGQAARVKRLVHYGGPRKFAGVDDD
jgi:hypothetical protein